MGSIETGTDNTPAIHRGPSIELIHHESNDETLGPVHDVTATPKRTSGPTARDHTFSGPNKRTSFDPSTSGDSSTMREFYNPVVIECRSQQANELSNRNDRAGPMAHLALDGGKKATTRAPSASRASLELEHSIKKLSALVYPSDTDEGIQERGHPTYIRPAIKPRATVPNTRPSPPQKSKSVIFVDRREEDRNPNGAMEEEVASSRRAIESANGPTTSGLSVDISIRYRRLTIAMVVIVVSVITFATVFQQGVVLRQFDRNSKNDNDLTTLLNDYNSYTGNAASILTKPVEPFVTLVVQVLVTRMLRSFMLRAQIGHQFDLLTLGISSGVVFLIINCFNALNVQLRAGKVQPIIASMDLKYDPDPPILAQRSSNFSQTFSEKSPHNPITNTVLRNLVLPRVPKKVPECSWAETSALNRIINTPPVPDTVLEYGFAQRDWQSRLLAEAIEPKSLHMDVNTGPNPRVNTTGLPMNASTAADLFVSSMYILEKTFSGLFVVGEVINFTFPDAPQLSQTYPFAHAMGLLPPSDTDLTEAESRAYLLDACMNKTKQVLAAAKRTRSNGSIEFAHVDISPLVAFDSFTLEFGVDPLLTPLTVSAGNGSSFTNLAMAASCLPFTARCMVPKAKYPTDSTAYDVSPQVHVFAPCTNSEGTEELRIVYSDSGETEAKMGLENVIDWRQDCVGISTSSLMVISIGKRVLADSLHQFNPPDQPVQTDLPLRVGLSNLRKVYTFTVGKLTWTLSNLSADFNATCSEGAGACSGLHFPLSTTSSSSSRQELVVGAQALPTDLFFPVAFLDTPRYLPLVQVHEPLRDTDENSPDYVVLLHDAHGGDPLLPHNVGNITWDTIGNKKVQEICFVDTEDRLKMLLNNHMYIEHGLQTAYTAATFFLLQNGVVHDIIQHNSSDFSLAFRTNQQNVTVFASVPPQNAWFSIAGCMLLLGWLVAIVLWSWVKSRYSAPSDWTMLGSVSAPHVIARAMLDSEHFPDVLLEWRVRLPDDEDSKCHPVDCFAIEALALRRPDEAPPTGREKTSEQK